jgi:hypothetical protein
MNRTCSSYGGRWGACGNLTEGNHLKYPGVDWRIILKWIFEKWNWWVGGMDWIDLAQERDRWRAGCFEYGNEPSGSIKCEEFLE